MVGIFDLLRLLERAFARTPLEASPPSAGRAENPDDTLALALSDVARHHGRSVASAALKSGLPLVDGHLPLEHVADAARRAGLAAEVVGADPLRLSEVELPAIVLLRDGSADVLWAIERGPDGAAAHVLATSPGRPDLSVRLPAAELAAAASGKIIRIRPAGGADGRLTGATVDSGDDWLRPAFAISSRVHAEAIGATVAINVLALAVPLFTMNVYDRVLPNAAAETLWSLALGVMLAILFDFVIRTLRGHFVDTAGRRADVLLGTMVFSRLVGARLEGPAPSAGVRANTMRELDTLREFYASTTLTVFGDLPFMILFIAMIGVLAGWLVVVPVLAIPIVLLIGWMTQRAIGRLMDASVKQSAVKNAVITETVSGLESIKAAGAESWAAAQWETASAESIRTGHAIKHRSNLGIFAVNAVQSLAQVLMIVAGFYLAAAGQLTMGALIAATMLAGRAMQPLSQIAMLVSKLHQTRLAYRLLDEIVRAPQERPDGREFITTHRVTGEITFESVRFRYEKDGEPVLDDVSFTIKPGEKVGLIGGIGSGKSTILKLVPGLRTPETGRVLIDGIPVGHLDPAVLRRDIGLALQQAELFHGTIRSNVTLGDPSVGEVALLEALKTAGALDWIARLPKGLETLVRERGAGLSGGQRQTLVLARALLRGPRIVLLDEPTSDLDPRAEQIVVDRLKPWLDGRSALIVTHRPALLALVDRLIVLEQGRKRLDGPKPAVMAALAAGSGLAVAGREERRRT